MGETSKTIIYSTISVLFSLSLVSSIWLGIENRRIYFRYIEESSLWSQRNRELEFKLDKFDSEIRQIKAKLKESSVYVEKLRQEKLEVEQRLQELAEENGKLREQVTRLVGEKEELNVLLNKYKQEKKDGSQDVFLSRILREKANLELRVNSLQKLLERKDNEIHSISKEREAFNQTLDELLNKKIEMENRLAETKTLISSLTQSLDQQQEEKLSYLREMEKLEKEKESLQLQMEKVQEEKSQLGEKIQGLEENVKREREEKEKFASQLGYINQVLEDMMLKATRLKQDFEVALEKIKKLSYNIKEKPVELPKIEIKNKLEGKIISLNLEKEFVIIDLGKRDGIESGMKFNVYREDKLVAKLEAIDVREVTAACKILLSLPQEKISENDLVILLKE